jgi:hypothetical protein
LLAWAPLPGALLFAFAGTVWSQAVVVEVYTLQVLLVTAFLYACAISPDHPHSQIVFWPLVALIFGLALTNHATALLLLPSLIVYLALSLNERARSSPRQPLPAWRSVGALLTPLLLYLYLPLRSHQDPDINWGYPDNWHRFLVHVTARQYHGKLGSEGIQLAELKRFFIEQLPAEATWLFVMLAGIGLVGVLKQSRDFGLVSLAAILAFLFYNMAYPIHDIHLYYIPVLGIMGIWAAVGTGILIRAACRRRARLGTVVTVLLCGISLFPLTTHWRQNDQHDFALLAHYVRDTLRTLEPNAVLFTGRWDSITSPALYYQVGEGFRHDVVVIDLGYLARPTLERHLRGRAPDLASACRAELAAVSEIALQAESGQEYNVAAAKEVYQQLQTKLVASAVDLRPTYVTSDLFRRPMVTGFNLITEGLVARVARQDSFREITNRFTGPGLRRQETRDERELNILKEYRNMLLNRAHYLRLHGRRDEAVALTRQAKQILP